MIVWLFDAIARLLDWRFAWPGGGAEDRLAAALDWWMPAGDVDVDVDEGCPYFVAELDRPDRCAYCGLTRAQHAPRALRDIG